MLRRIAWILFLTAAAAADILLFRGGALVARAKSEISAEVRIAVLEKEQSVLPLNDELYRLLGKAHFEAGSERMGDVPVRDAHFKTAQSALLQSLRLNPLSAAAHFELAQGLEFFRLVGIPGDLRPFQEYLNAARLGLQDPEIIDASGRLLLSQWAALDDSEKRLTRGLLRTILTGRGEDTLLSVLNTWALHVGDYEVIKSILPADAAVYRRFALFLAERSLDRSERIEALIRAETLEFEQARAAAAAGRSEFQAYKLKPAEAHFRRAQELLQGIRFYQSLAGTAAIDPAEFRSLRGTVALGLVQTRLETVRSFDEILSDAQRFLDEEDGSAAIGDLEHWLKGRRLIDDRLDASGKDLRRLAFEMRLSYEQNRYREVTEAGQSLESGVLIVPEASKKDYAAILELVGDAFFKLDYLYESTAFYQKARAAAGGGPGLLYKLRRNYERLNDNDGLRSIDKEILATSASQTIDWEGVVAAKGTAFVQTLFLDGGAIRLELRVPPEKEGALRPYAAVFFNGRVIWDDFLPEGGGLRLDLTPRLGPNMLEILPLNRPLDLAGLDIRPAPEPGADDSSKKKEAQPAGKTVPKRRP
jgi:hypothetical protein